ncbi:ATP-binding protein [Steroidobacter sp. S1-65]|uniref:ATP-binding protein n=1 Tax=Steroidobacter gossypii TaxID=2805490 RepID=A0ABS1WRK4_9GAMM|nr:AAA family ATPase [Steroidobacter gossypii]MBM0103605.1 ATP-binding protein [Steroidobacter gossypii]
MPAPHGAPAWANELALAYESGAHGQFILYGNVHDRIAVGAQLVGLTGYLEHHLLSSFQIVLSYDLGSGLTIERGGELVEKWGGADLKSLPREPQAALQYVSRYLRYLGNLRALGREVKEHVAVILRSVDHIVPADGVGFEHGSLTSVLREWSSEAPFADLPFTSILIADNLNDVEPLVAFSTHASRIRVPLPDSAEIERALTLLRTHEARAFTPDANLAQIGAALVGVTLTALESLVKMRDHSGQPLNSADLTRIKKELVERDSAGLVEFIESTRTLDAYHGQDALKRWLRQDIKLWQTGDLKALPMGYLLCGPVGTGKTFLVECLAGEAGVPVVKLKNFRDRWVGSSEGNLEKIFRLIRALGRCMVFIDEADQTLGRRDSGSGDSGLSGRLYSMIAQEMSDTSNRGRVLWILASSRPDLIEVDLKRPGRVDVKVPLLPTSTTAESAALIGALAKRYGLQLNEADLTALEPRMPLLLTPGAAEALVVKAYRRVRTEYLEPRAALDACLVGYQNPVPADVLEFQMRISIREATDLAFVPAAFHKYAEPATAVPIAP